MSTDEAPPKSRRVPSLDPPEVRPLLPLVYVAWADGMLSPKELDTVRERLANCAPLAPPSREALEAWLDPHDPPTAEELETLRQRVRRAAAASVGSCNSLIELGLATARAAGALGPEWETPEARAALAEVEALLGVEGADAARALLAGESRPEPTPETADPALRVERLHRFLEGDHWELRQALLSLMGDERFHNDPELPRPAYRARVLKQLHILAELGYGSLGYPTSVGGKDDMGAAVAAFETLAFGDVSLLVKFGVQFGLFGGSILNLGTEEHHRAYLRPVGRLDLPGCFAMSETGHGSNVRDIETTATYDPGSEEFVIHTPHPSARKDWIGNAAEHGQLATVFAQLNTGGSRHGVHAFLVRIRNGSGQPAPGVTIEDCGHKVGLNGVDNGKLSFDRVRVPRLQLLDRFAQVAPDGTYSSPIPGEGRRFFTMLGTLVAGRVSIAAAAVSSAKTALTIAVRYSARRHQFGPEGEPEVPILDYLMQQRLLLPRLATTYGLHFAVRALAGRFATTQGQDRREFEVIAAGLKAFASAHNVETIQACREACGGRGYLAENRLGRLRADTDVFTTFEGANVVLLQLVAKGLLSRYKRQMGDLSFWSMARHLADRAGARVREANPVIARRHDPDHLADPEFHEAVFSWRVERLLVTAAARLKARMDDGMRAFEAMNACQDHLVTLAEAHVDRLILSAFGEGLATAPDGRLGLALRDLQCLFALTTIERHAAWHLEAGTMEPVKTKAIRTEVNRLCGAIRPVAVALVDAFGIPPGVLRAPAALTHETRTAVPGAHDV